jgi:excisionase family DNA binding protein
MVDEFRKSLLSITEVAKHLKVHVGTPHRWIHSGVRGRRLPSMLMGGRRYVRISDLEEFLQAPPTDTPASEDHRNRAAQQQLASFGLTAQRGRNSKS